MRIMTSAAAFRRRLRRDVIIIGVSVIAAFALAQSGFLQDFFAVTPESTLVGVFLAGILFTSLFTTPIAIAMFLSLAPGVNLLTMAGIGALGSVVGDLVLFGLIRFTFQEDVQHLLGMPKYRRLFHVFHRRTFRWMLPFLGALVIASPLPDELGIGLMGVSRMKASTLIVISYVMNAIGIALIYLAA